MNMDKEEHRPGFMMITQFFLVLNDKKSTSHQHTAVLNLKLPEGREGLQRTIYILHPRSLLWNH